jgi:hypothetical protein
MNPEFLEKTIAGLSSWQFPLELSTKKKARRVSVPPPT